jgi:hypothetical protein
MMLERILGTDGPLVKSQNRTTGIYDQHPMTAKILFSLTVTSAGAGIGLADGLQ